MGRVLLCSIAVASVLISAASYGLLADATDAAKSKQLSADHSASAVSAANASAASAPAASAPAADKGETPQAEKGKTGAPQTASPKYDPSGQYDVQQIEGWKILVNKKFRPAEPEIYQKAMKQLEVQLYNITRVVPEPALGKIRTIHIWVELFERHHPCMAYHPDASWLAAHDMNPEKAKCVEMANARNFIAWTHEQPWMVLHELSHGYHDQFLAGGFENVEIRAAYQHAMDEKLYEAVLRRGVKLERAYAATNPMEYFAESTEAFFGTNDFYPFVRVELRQHDIQGYEMEKRAWGINSD